MKPKILKLKESGEYFDYLEDLYESIDYDKHYEELKNGSKTI